MTKIAQQVICLIFLFVAECVAAEDYVGDRGMHQFITNGKTIVAIHRDAVEVLRFFLPQDGWRTAPAVEVDRVDWDIHGIPPRCIN